MSVTMKLLIFALLNIAALVFLTNRLMLRGNDFSGALRLAWDLIVGQPQAPLNFEIYSSFIWVPILHKSWWLMLISYGISWFISEDLWLSCGIAFLVIIHIVWYLYASLSVKTKYDRILHFTLDWGMIFQEIDAGSFLIQKSLAELDLRKKNILVLAIERNHQLNPFPKGMEIIEAGDRIVMFGDLSAYRAAFGD